MRDPGEHHLHTLVARAECDAHLVETHGQGADLVASLDRDRAREVAGADALGGRGQAFERPGHAPGEPRRQGRNDRQASRPAQGQIAAERGEGVQVLGARLDDGEAGRRIANARVAALVGPAVAADEERRGRGPAQARPLDLRRVGLELVGSHTQRQRALAIRARRQVARHQQDPAHGQPLARLRGPVAEIGVGVRLLVTSRDGRELLGQHQQGHRGRGRGQPTPQLVLEHPSRNLVGRDREEQQGQNGGHEHGHEQLGEESSTRRLGHAA